MPNSQEVVFRSERVFGGAREVSVQLRTLPDGRDCLVWKNQDDAPYFIIERGKELLQWKD